PRQRPGACWEGLGERGFVEEVESDVLDGTQVDQFLNDLLEKVHRHGLPRLGIGGDWAERAPPIAVGGDLDLPSSQVKFTAERIRILKPASADSFVYQVRPKKVR